MAGEKNVSTQVQTAYQSAKIQPPPTPQHQIRPMRFVSFAAVHLALMLLATIASPIQGQSVQGQSIQGQSIQGQEVDGGIRNGDACVFDIGMVWSGVLTQQGVHPKLNHPPPRYTATFHVTDRDDDRFTANLIEQTGGIRVTYEVQGDVVEEPNRDRVRIRFESTQMKQRSGGFEFVTGIFYAACIIDDKLTGLWKHQRNDQGITLNGTLDLKRDAALEQDPPNALSPLLPRLNVYENQLLKVKR